MIMQPILTHMMVVMIYLFTITKENLDHTLKEVHLLLSLGSKARKITTFRILGKRGNI